MGVVVITPLRIWGTNDEIRLVDGEEGWAAGWGASRWIPILYVVQ